MRRAPLRAPNASAGKNGMDRRGFLMSAGAAALAGAATRSRAEGPAAKSFPRGFLWGAATAAHQVEGNNVNNDNWLLEHVKPTLFAEPVVDRKSTRLNSSHMSIS